MGDITHMNDIYLDNPTFFDNFKKLFSYALGDIRW